MAQALYWYRHWSTQCVTALQVILLIVLALVPRQALYVIALVISVLFPTTHIAARGKTDVGSDNEEQQKEAEEEEKRLEEEVGCVVQQNEQQEDNDDRRSNNNNGNGSSATTLRSSTVWVMKVVPPSTTTAPVKSPRREAKEEGNPVKKTFRRDEHRSVIQSPPPQKYKFIVLQRQALSRFLTIVPLIHVVVAGIGGILVAAVPAAHDIYSRNVEWFRTLGVWDPSEHWAIYSILCVCLLALSACSNVMARRVARILLCVDSERHPHHRKITDSGAGGAAVMSGEDGGKNSNNTELQVPLLGAQASADDEYDERAQQSSSSSRHQQGGGPRGGGGVNGDDEVELIPVASSSCETEKKQSCEDGGKKEDDEEAVDDDRVEMVRSHHSRLTPGRSTLMSLLLLASVILAPSYLTGWFYVLHFIFIGAMLIPRSTPWKWRLIHAASSVTLFSGLVWLVMVSVLLSPPVTFSSWLPSSASLVLLGTSVRSTFPWINVNGTNAGVSSYNSSEASSSSSSSSSLDSPLSIDTSLSYASSSGYYTLDLDSLVVNHALDPRAAVSVWLIMACLAMALAVHTARSNVGDWRVSFTWQDANAECAKAQAQATTARRTAALRMVRKILKKKEKQQGESGERRRNLIKQLTSHFPLLLIPVLWTVSCLVINALSFAFICVCFGALALQRHLFMLLLPILYLICILMAMVTYFSLIASDTDDMLTRSSSNTRTTGGSGSGGWGNAVSSSLFNTDMPFSMAVLELGLQSVATSFMVLALVIYKRTPSSERYFHSRDKRYQIRSAFDGLSSDDLDRLKLQFLEVCSKIDRDSHENGLVYTKTGLDLVLSALFENARISQAYVLQRDEIRDLWTFFVSGTNLLFRRSSPHLNESRLRRYRQYMGLGGVAAAAATAQSSSSPSSALLHVPATRRDMSSSSSSDRTTSVSVDDEEELDLMLLEQQVFGGALLSRRRRDDRMERETSTLASSFVGQDYDALASEVSESAIEMQTTMIMEDDVPAGGPVSGTTGSSNNNNSQMNALKRHANAFSFFDFVVLSKFVQRRADVYRRSLEEERNETGVFKWARRCYRWLWLLYEFLSRSTETMALFGMFFAAIFEGKLDLEQFVYVALFTFFLCAPLRIRRIFWPMIIVHTALHISVLYIYGLAFRNSNDDPSRVRDNEALVLTGVSVTDAWSTSAYLLVMVCAVIQVRLFGKHNISLERIFVGAEWRVLMQSRLALWLQFYAALALAGLTFVCVILFERRSVLVAGFVLLYVALSSLSVFPRAVPVLLRFQWLYSVVALLLCSVYHVEGVYQWALRTIKDCGSVICQDNPSECMMQLGFSLEQDISLLRSLTPWFMASIMCSAVVTVVQLWDDKERQQPQHQHDPPAEEEEGTELSRRHLHDEERHTGDRNPLRVELLHAKSTVTEPHIRAAFDVFYFLSIVMDGVHHVLVQHISKCLWILMCVVGLYQRNVGHVVFIVWFLLDFRSMWVTVLASLNMVQLYIYPLFVFPVLPVSTDVAIYFGFDKVVLSATSNSSAGDFLPVLLCFLVAVLERRLRRPQSVLDAEHVARVRIINTPLEILVAQRELRRATAQKEEQQQQQQARSRGGVPQPVKSFSRGILEDTSAVCVPESFSAPPPHTAAVTNGDRLSAAAAGPVSSNRSVLTHISEFIVFLTRDVWCVCSYEMVVAALSITIGVGIARITAMVCLLMLSVVLIVGRERFTTNPRWGNLVMLFFGIFVILSCLLRIGLPPSWVNTDPFNPSTCSSWSEYVGCSMPLLDISFVLLIFAALRMNSYFVPRARLAYHRVEGHATLGRLLEAREEQRRSASSSSSSTPNDASSMDALADTIPRPPHTPSRDPKSIAEGIIAMVVFVPPTALLCFVDGVTQPSILGVVDILIGLLLLAFKQRVHWNFYVYWPKVIGYLWLRLVLQVVVNIPWIRVQLVNHLLIARNVGVVPWSLDDSVSVTSSSIALQVATFVFAVCQWRVYNEFYFAGELIAMHAKVLLATKNHDRMLRLQKAEAIQQQMQAADDEETIRKKLIALRAEREEKHGRGRLSQDESLKPVRREDAVRCDSVVIHLGHDDGKIEDEKGAGRGVTSQEGNLMQVEDSLVVSSLAQNAGDAGVALPNEKAQRGGWKTRSQSLFHFLLQDDSTLPEADDQEDGQLLPTRRAASNEDSGSKSDEGTSSSSDRSSQHNEDHRRSGFVLPTALKQAQRRGQTAALRKKKQWAAALNDIASKLQRLFIRLIDHVIATLTSLTYTGTLPDIDKPRWYRLTSVTLRVLVKNSQYLCFMMFAINFAFSVTLIDLVIVLSAFMYAMIVHPWPDSMYWDVLLLYNCLCIVLKSIVDAVLDYQNTPLATLRWISITFLNTGAWDATSYSSSSSSLAQNATNRSRVSSDLATSFVVFACCLIHRQWSIDRGVFRSSPMYSFYNKKNTKSEYDSPLASPLSPSSSSSPTRSSLLRPSVFPSYTETVVFVKDMWKNWVTRRGAGKDLYTLHLGTQILVMVLFIAMYYRLSGQASGSILEGITQDLLPGAAVTVVMSLVLIMCAERVVYVTSSIRLKILLHMLQVLLYCLGLMFWTVYVPTSVRYCGQLVYLAGMLSCGISALQIRSGFPLHRRHDPFTCSTGFFHWLGYTVYRAVPFGFELRLLLDWSFTKTALSLSSWTLLEDVHNEVYIRYVDIEESRETNPQLGVPYPFVQKLCRGVIGFALVLAILFFPLMFYSTYNPSLSQNSVTEMTTSVSFRGLVDVYSSSAHSVASVEKLSSSGSYGVMLDRTRPKLAKYQIFQDRSVQLLRNARCSSSTWIASPVTKLSLLNTTVSALAGNTTLTLRSTVALTRAGAAAGGSLTQTILMDYTLGPESLGALYTALTASSSSFSSSSYLSNSTPIQTVINQYAIPLPLFYSPFLQNRPSGVQTLSTFLGDGDGEEDADIITPPTGPRQDWSVEAVNRLRCNLTLNNQWDPSIGSRTEFWCLECNTLFTSGMVPEAAKPKLFPESECIRGTSRCTDAFNFEVHPPNKTSTGMYYVIANDQVANATQVLSSFGIVALYTTFILAIGSVLRNSVSGASHRVVLSQVRDPTPVAELLQCIYLTRYAAARPEDDQDNEGGGDANLALEEELFAELVDLLRSPEKLLSLSGLLASSSSSSAHATA